MADTDVILGVDFDTKDAKKTAENLGKEVDAILKQDKNSKNTAILNLDNQMKSSIVSADKLSKKLEALEAQKIPTESYQELDNKLANLNKEFDKLMDESDKLIESKQRFDELGESADRCRNTISMMEKALKEGQFNGQKLGVDDTMKLTGRISELKEELSNTEQEMDKLSKDFAKWEEVDSRVEDLSTSIHNTETEMQNLVDTGKAFTLGSETEEYLKTERELDNINSKLNVQIIKHRQINDKIGETPKIVDSIKKSWIAIGNVINGLNSKLNSIIGRWKQATKQVISHRKELGKTDLTLGSLVKKILMYGLGIRGLFSLVSQLRTTLKQGLSDVYDSGQLTELNTKIDNLKNSLTTLRNAFVGAFAPIIDVAIPYLQKLVEWLTKAVGMAAQLIAALTGKKTYLKAVKQTSKEVKKEKEEIEDENEALEEQQRQLSGLDKLNVLTSPRENKQKKNEKEKAADDIADAMGPLFEEVPIDSEIAKFAEKIKKMLKDLIYPIKKAWNDTSKFVLNAWKKAIKSMKKLAGTIWDDFIKVWKQEATVEIFRDLFKIVGDIGLIIANLADRIREAWEANDNGLHILEAIRDIFGIIVKYIRMMADATVKWSRELNFEPLFTAIRKWLESLKPVVEAIMGVIYDLYTQVVLPFTKYLIEKGLPALFDVFSKFNEMVDWEGLRQKLSELWEALEPFMEKAWEGFVIFVERIATAVANFINSEEFANFLDKVKDWMNSVTAEDIANTLENLAKAIIAIKVAALGFKVVSAVIPVFKAFASVIKFFSGKGAVDAVAGMSATSSGLAGVATAIGSLLAVLAAGGAGLSLGDFISKSLGMGSVKDYTDGGLWDTTRKMFEDTLFLFQDVDDAFAEHDWGRLGTDIILGICGGLMGAFEFLFEPFSDLFDFVFSGIAKVFGIASPAKEMYPLGENILLGIVEGFKSQIDAILAPIKELKDKIVEEWVKIKTNLQEKMTEIKSDLQEKWTTIKNDTVNKVLEIKTNIQNKFIEIKTNISNKITEIKNSWSSGWNTMVNKVTSATQSIRNIVGSVMNWVNSKIASMKSAWNSAKETISNSWVGNVAGFLPFKAPKAATGAVIPPQMSQRMFTVGDNNSETEVISPLSTMKEAMIEALTQTGLGNNSNSDIVINIDGREVFRAVRKEANQYSNQHGGRSAFAGA